MNDKAFFDTNILVYAHDKRDEAKYNIANSLFRNCMGANTAVLSSQVIQEFCNVALKSQTTFRMHSEELKQLINQAFVPLMAHVPYDVFYSRAIELYADYSLSWYDALIVQAALDLNCTILYSEDLQAGQTFGPLTVVNPFC